MSIFVSYRRSDAGGHAGRLCDDLEDRLGPDQVFQDVESIAPGEDFVVAIQRALARADAALVVIGPDWLDATDVVGVRRLDHPDDLVRVEVVTALAADIRVVPVLVGGASMPAAVDLPADLAALARRNAVALDAEEWDDDLDRLLRAVGRGSPPRPAPPVPTPATAPGPTTAPSSARGRPGRTAVALVMVAAAAVVVTVLLPGDAPSDQPAVAVQPTATPATTGAVSPGSTTAVPTAAATPWPLPDATTTVVFPGGREPIEFTVEELGWVPDAGIVHLRLQVHNTSGSQAYLPPSAVQVVLDGTVVSAVDDRAEAVGGRGTVVLDHDFPAPGRPDAVAVDVTVQSETGTVPIVPSPPPPSLPVLTTEPVSEVMGTTTFRLGPPELTAHADAAVVTVPITATNDGRADVNFWDRDFRLRVHGDPTPPVGELLNELLSVRATMRAALTWQVPLDDGALVLVVDHQGEHAEVPLTTTAD